MLPAAAEFRMVPEVLPGGAVVAAGGLVVAAAYGLVQHVAAGVYVAGEAVGSAALGTGVAGAAPGVFLEGVGAVCAHGCVCWVLRVSAFLRMRPAADLLRPRMAAMSRTVLPWLLRSRMFCICAVSSSPSLGLRCSFSVEWPTGSKWRKPSPGSISQTMTLSES